MKKTLFLNGYLKTGNESLGPFAVDLNFDEKLPGYKQKRGILYAVNDKQVMSRLYAFMRSLSFDKEAVFESKYENSIIELRGFSPKSIPISDRLSNAETNTMIRICEFTFQTFIKRIGIIPEGIAPSEIFFHIEDMVFFRPTLKGTSSFLSPFGEPKDININLREFENYLQFETDNLSFKTSCEITAPATTHNRYDVSVITKPMLVIKPKVSGLTENDIINAGNDLFLLLSFLEERFINYFAITICYQLKEEERYAYEFRHTHYSEPMKKPKRSDLAFRMPMDKLSYSDIKTAYLSYEHFTNNLKINFAQVIYLYLNAVKATMIYYPIIDFYSCIEKMLKIGPKTLKDFRYPRLEEEEKHGAKVKLLCPKLEIDYSDLLSKNGNLEYIQIRNDYIHNILRKKYTDEEIWDAEKMVGYLARRLIFSFLKLNYKNYNSCDPRKRGRIGL